MNAHPPPTSPWSPAEKTELLCEIIKASGIHPDALRSLIRSLPSPNWDDLIIPRGRSLNQCKAMFGDYTQSMTPLLPPQPPSFHEPPRPPDFGRQGLYEGPSGIPPPIVVPPPGIPMPLQIPRYTEIQPKPAAPPGVLISPPPQPEKRRRGRPTKIEAERRKEAQRAREAFYAPTRDSQVGPIVSTPSLATQAAQLVMNPQLAPRPSNVSVESPPMKRKRTDSMEGAESGHARDASDVLPNIGGALAESRGYRDILRDDSNQGPTTFRGPR